MASDPERLAQAEENQPPTLQIPHLLLQQVGIQFPYGKDVLISEDIFETRALRTDPELRLNSVAKIWTTLLRFDSSVEFLRSGGTLRYSPRSMVPYQAAVADDLHLFCKEGDMPPSPDTPIGRPLMSIQETSKLLATDWVHDIRGIGDKSVRILHGVVEQYKVFS